MEAILRNSQAQDQLVKAMAAFLQVTLEDLRSQYRRVLHEAARLEQFGDAINQLEQQLGVPMKEVIPDGTYPVANRRVRRTGLSAPARREVPPSHHTTPSTSPVAGKTAHRQTHDQAGGKGA
jgi:hypothetical protein